MSEREFGVEAGRWTSQDRAAWYEARNSMILLRDVLIAAGLAEDFPYLRADINAFGHGIVELGRTTPEAVARLSALMSLGLSVNSSMVQKGNDKGVS